MLLRTIYLSLDPYMRGRMSAGKTYAKPVEIGEVMVGGTVCEVVASRRPRLRRATSCWPIRAGRTMRFRRRELRKLDPGARAARTALGVLGMPGLTAYAGLLTSASPSRARPSWSRPPPARSARSSGQLARLKGARAVGIAGGPDKCALLTEELGFDACRRPPRARPPEQLAAACPTGIDVYFENVGGEVFDAVFPLLNDFARMPVCGLIASYNDTQPPPGPTDFRG